MKWPRKSPKKQQEVSVGQKGAREGERGRRGKSKSRFVARLQGAFETIVRT